MIVMEKRLSKYTLIGGFVSAFVGYSFWDYLWKGSYYQLITMAFCFYTYTIYNECSTNVWKCISFCIFISTINAFHDELIGQGTVFDYSEYFSFLTIIIFIFVTKRFK
jgi:hypothetical protein